MGNSLIRALLIAAALLCLTERAQAQCSGQPGANQFCAGPSSGGSGLPGWRVMVGADLPSPISAPIQVNSTLITGGVSGRVPFNNAGTYGEYVMSGDCTLAVPSITCSKTGGVAFALSATTDATNATNIGTGTLNSGRLDLASTAQFASATANKVLAADKVFGPEGTITYGATTNIDFSTFVSNAAVTLTGNITTITFANAKAGQAGLIRFIQGGAGGFTIPTTINSTMKCAGGCSYTLSTAVGAVDVLGYTCVSATYCIGGGLLKDVK